MRYLLKFLCLALLLGICSTSLFAQEERVRIGGTVSEKATGEILPMVVLNLREAEMWTTSDLEGVFSFQNVPAGRYTLSVTCLGFMDYQKVIEVDAEHLLFNVLMDETSLALDEVVVTAEEGGKMNSSSSIGKSAIEHLQGSSLTDVMQLLPGALTVNPTLTSVNKLTIRDISTTDNTSALGTAVIVDGAQMLNDANLQMTTPESASGDFASTGGSGVDARQIPVDNVESVEVIRGIASAEYGNMTSGAVVVKTKAGKSPFETRVKSDPTLKQVAFGQGFRLGKRGGHLNLNADYAKAYTDTRTPAQSYNRITLQTGYSNIFQLKEDQQVSFNAKLNGHFTIDRKKHDADQTVEELYESEDSGLNFNLHGIWELGKSWISELKYNLAGSYARQMNREKVWHSSVRMASTDIRESGEATGTLLPYQYFSNLTIEGKPLYGNLKLTAMLSDQYGKVGNRLLLGIDLNAKGNIGEGKTFEAGLTPTQNLRPRPFTEIPFLYDYTLFAEEQASIPLFSHQILKLQAGLRATWIDAKGYDYPLIFDPRLNAQWVIREDYSKKHLKLLSLRVGWGVLHKMPTLLYLYPDPSYTDVTSFIYNDESTDHNLTVITTRVNDPTNRELGVPGSRNFEVGMDIKVGKTTVNLAFFNEKLTNGYSFAVETSPFYYREYASIDYSGAEPEYRNGKVMLGEEALPYTVDASFATVSRPSNGIQHDKYGCEFTADFGKIDALFTSIRLDGAYFHIKKLYTELTAAYPGGELSGENYPYAAIYAGRNASSNGTVSERFNTNLRFITHIPALKMIFTLTAQGVWVETSRRIAEYQGESLLHDTPDSENMSVYPLYYMDREGELYPFTEAEASSNTFRKMVKSAIPSFYDTDYSKPYFMLNLRLSKEIGRYVSLSFYANNMTNSKPIRYNASTKSYVRLNSNLSFGAEMTVKL